MVFCIGDMRSISLHLLVGAVVLALLFCTYCDGYHVPAESSSQIKNNVFEALTRERRQVETFDDDEYTTGPSGAQEETGFWDRVVNVALKLFSKFVEWLNS